MSRQCQPVPGTKATALLLQVVFAKLKHSIFIRCTTAGVTQIVKQYFLNAPNVILTALKVA